MTDLRHDEVREKLELIFDFMLESKASKENKEDKLLNASLAAKKTSIIDDVCDALEDVTFTNDDIRNPEVQKRLMGAILSSALGRKEDMQASLDPLTNPEQDDEMQNEKNNTLDKMLEQTFSLVQLLKIANDKLPKNDKLAPSPDASAKNMLDQYKMKMQAKLKEKYGHDEKQLKEMEKKLDEFCNKMLDPLSFMLRNMNGGDDPRISGEVPFPILGPIIGNLTAMTNQTIPDPNAHAEMVRLITYNSEGPNYLGQETQAIVANIATGSFLADALENTLKGVSDDINDCTPGARTPTLTVGTKK